MSVSLEKTPDQLCVAHLGDATPAEANAVVMAASVKRIKAMRLKAERERKAALIAPGDKPMRSRADALELIKAMPRNALFFLHVRIDAELPDKPGMCIRDGFSGSLRITRVRAESLVGDMFHDSLAARGAVLNMTVHEWAGHSKHDFKLDRLVMTDPTPVLYIG